MLGTVFSLEIKGLNCWVRLAGWRRGAGHGGIASPRLALRANIKSPAKNTRSDLSARLKTNYLKNADRSGKILGREFDGDVRLLVWRI